jgi:hypothetical protein
LGGATTCISSSPCAPTVPLSHIGGEARRQDARRLYRLGAPSAQIGHLIAS